MSPVSSASGRRSGGDKRKKRGTQDSSALCGTEHMAEEPGEKQHGYRNTGYREGDRGQGYVLSLDVGTTTIRGYVYDSKANVIGCSSDRVGIV